MISVRKKKKMDKIIHHPWVFQIEPTEGCTRSCRFCGLNLQRKKPGQYLHMPLTMIEKIAEDGYVLNPNARIELAMHGEPLVHPQIDEIIRILRKKFEKTQIQLTTNGNPIMGKMSRKIRKLFDAGLDILVIDTYKPERDRLQKEILSLKDQFTLIDFYKDWAPKGLSPWNNYKRKYSGTVVIMDDISFHNNERKNRTLSNHNGGNLDMSVPDSPVEKMCVIPFRGMSICADGNVPLCCDDFGNDYVCGNVLYKTLSEIWYGNRFRAARRFIRNKMRYFSPCIRCNNGSGSRSGLVPKYPMPTEKDTDLVKKVIFTGRHKNAMYKPEFCEVKV